jgi:microcystin-dependent protein
MNYLGTQIGGSSTVSIEEIQPVGTIMPYAAGGTVPETWLECNGASYGVTEYPELYTALLSTTGDAIPKYGYVATLTGTNVSSVLAAGDYIQYKADTNAFTGTGSPFAGAATNASLLALVLSVTSTSAVVQVIPTYSGTNKNFTINNTVFAGGGFVGSETGTGNYRAYTNASAFKPVSLTISTVAITHFNTPDLRGRFALGVNAPNGIGELEIDQSYNSAISGIYSLGSEGGEESHILAADEMPIHSHSGTVAQAGAHTHTTQSAGSHLHTLFAANVINGAVSTVELTATDQVASTGGGGDNSDFAYGLKKTSLGASVGRSSTAGDHTHTTDSQGNHTHTVTISNSGSNTAHNNIPPYLAIRYIIKASPYTRAAIIDGVDIPYDQLLVGDLRSGLLRNAGVGEDLIFKTNTSVATTGTERMRLTNGGNLGIGTTTPTAAFEVIGGVSASGAMSGSRLSVSGGITAGTDIVSTSGNLHLLNASSAGVATKTGTLHLGVATGLDNGAIANDKIGLTVKTDKRVGVNGIYDPSTSLSVLSEGGSSILSGGVRVWRSASSGAGNPNTAYVSLDADSNGGAILSWGDGFRFKTGATGANNATTDRVFIKNDGKVGIGTSTPASELDVQGSIRATQLITASGGISVGNFAASNVMPKLSGTTLVATNPATEAANPNPVVGQPFRISLTSDTGSIFIGRTGQTWLCIAKSGNATTNGATRLMTIRILTGSVNANSTFGADMGIGPTENMDIVGFRIA